MNTYNLTNWNYVSTHTAVFLLYGERNGAEDLLGVYSAYAVAAEVGKQFVLEGTYEKYNIEQWEVLEQPILDDHFY